MNSYLLKNLSGITSASIEKYLLFTGWEKDDTFANPKIWVFKNKYDSELTIAVPANEHVKDFYSRVYSLIQTLSTINEKTEKYRLTLQLVA